MEEEKFINKLEDIPGLVTDDEELNAFIDSQENPDNDKKEPEKKDEGEKKPESKNEKSNDDNKKSKEEEERDKEREEEERINRELDEQDKVETEPEKTKTEKTQKPAKTKNNDDDDDKMSYLSVIEMMRKKKIIDFDDPDEGEEPYNEEEAAEILEEAINDKVNSQLQDIIHDLDPIAKSIIKYSIDGGDTKDFIEKFLDNNKKVDDKLDLSKKENQKAVIRESLKNLDYDDETIDAQIEFFEDSGQLEKRAKSMYDKMIERQKKEYEEELKNQERRKAEYIEKMKEQRKEFDTYIQGLDEIGSMKMSKQDKRELTSYIMDRNIKTKNQGNITNFHADLGEVLQNREASLQLAKLLRNRDKNGLFKFDDIIRDTETQVTNRVRDNLRRKQSSAPKSGGANISKEKKSLLDWLEN